MRSAICAWTSGARPRFWRRFLPEIRQRLHFMDEVGLDYLSLDRATNTLSGGEAQRIRLAAQLGSNLSGVLYVLRRALHRPPRTRQRPPPASLAALRAKGKLPPRVVEHDPRDHARGPTALSTSGRGPVAMAAKSSPKAISTPFSHPPTSLTGRYLKAGMVHPFARQVARAPPPPTRHAGRRRQRIGSSSKSRACATSREARSVSPKGRLIGVVRHLRRGQVHPRARSSATRRGRGYSRQGGAPERLRRQRPCP